MSQMAILKTKYYIIIREMLFIINVSNKYKIDSVFQFIDMELQKFVGSVLTEFYKR